MPMTWGN